MTDRPAAAPYRGGMDDLDIAGLYVEARRSFVALCDELTDVQWATTVPCNPDWRVWDVLSHVAGVTDDIVSGRVEGAATDPWTAAQVERWRETPRGELLDRWGRQIADAAGAIGAIGEIRPPLDCHTHEHDVRHALGLPGNRDSDLVRWTAARFGESPLARAVTIEFDDGEVLECAGRGAPVRLRGISRFELVRSRLGRRARSQVEAYEWSEPPAGELLADWFVFGPSPLPIVE